MGGNIQQMRQMLQQHPEQLQILKQRLQTEHPELAQVNDRNLFFIIFIYSFCFY
jgi:hypothetical protein